MVAVFYPAVYGEPVYSAALVAPETYGEDVLVNSDNPASAGAALGTGSAFDASVSVAASAGQASGTGTAYDTLPTKPVWTTPLNNVSMSNQPELKFTIPSLPYTMFFYLQLDKVVTFDGADLREARSDMDQTGWHYWDGGAWQAVTSAGIPSTYGGNEARYTVSDTLSDGVWYRRVFVGIES